MYRTGYGVGGMKRQIFGAILLGIGLALVAHSSGWMLAAGMFFAVWGNNIQQMKEPPK